MLPTRNPEEPLFSPQMMGGVKRRQEFDTKHDGIDSNTISSSEDNVLIMLTAWLTLMGYYLGLSAGGREEEVTSILLVDEFDATLHPSFQFKMPELFELFSATHHIQVVFTTHSIILLERMLKRIMNVTYLMHDGNVVKSMPEPDALKIEMFLKSETRDGLLRDRTIPVFTEDEQAILFSQMLIRELGDLNESFCRVERTLHCFDANF